MGSLETGKRAGLLLGALLLAGCGGGGGGGNGSGSGPAIGAGEQEMEVGGLVTRVAGTTQPPVTQSGQGAVVTGIAGGTVSSLAYTAPPATPAGSAAILAQTKIAFAHSPNIAVMGSDGASPTMLTTYLPGTNTSAPAWSPDGSKIAFAHFDSAVGRDQIYTMPANGTGVTRVSNGAADDSDPTWSPDGTKIAFQRYDSALGHWQIWVMSASGANLHIVSDGTTQDLAPSWSPDGSKIAFQRYDIVARRWQLYTMVAAGGSVKNVTPNLTGYDLYSPAWSPDGSKIAFNSTLGTTYAHIAAVTSDGLSWGQLTSGTTDDSSPTWSADGTRIAFQRLDTAVNRYQIYVMATDGTGTHRISDGTSNDQMPAWSPYVKARKFVGAGGTFGASASGFLVGQQGKVTTSLVVFNAKTPNSAHLDVQGTTLPYQPNLVFAVSGDLLNALAYVNSLTGSPTPVLNATSTATGAVVSFDASDGTVTGVFPYTANKAQGHGGAPALQAAGDALVYRGAFLGVWDGAGQNRAPNGASEIQIDGRTGHLISFQ